MEIIFECLTSENSKREMESNKSSEMMIFLIGDFHQAVIVVIVVE